MPFAPIDLTKSGNIRYSLQRLARDARPFLSIIHLAFSGNYRNGSAGGPDARYIRGVVGITNNVWRPSGIILDLSDLTYEWGDEMGDVVEAPSNHPFAIVVSPLCEPAISSLCCASTPSKTVLDREQFFDSFEAALHYLRQQIVHEWHALLAKYPEGTEGTDLINVSDLE